MGGAGVQKSALELHNNLIPTEVIREDDKMLRAKVIGTGQMKTGIRRAMPALLQYGQY